MGRMELSTLLFTVALISMTTICSANTNPPGKEEQPSYQFNQLEDKTFQLVFQIVHQVENIAAFLLQIEENAVAASAGKKIDKALDRILKIGPYPSKFHLNTFNGDVVEGPFRAHYEAENVDIEDVKSLRRRGDTRVRMDKGVYIVQVHLAFGKLSATIGKLALDLLQISLRGSLSAEATKNSFLIDVEVSKNPCKARLKSFKLVDLDYAVKAKLDKPDQKWWRKELVQGLVYAFKRYGRGTLEKMTTRVLSELVVKYQNLVCKIVK